MALRLLYFCLCTSLLLAAGVALPRPAPSPAPAASAMARNDCYKTVKGVPEWCSRQFLSAVFAGKKDGITRDCCILLACVREWTCADVLRGFCLPPHAGECTGSPKRLTSSRPTAIAPAVTTGASN